MPSDGCASHQSRLVGVLCGSLHGHGPELFRLFSVLHARSRLSMSVMQMPSEVLNERLVSTGTRDDRRSARWRLDVGSVPANLPQHQACDILAFARLLVCWMRSVT